MLSPLCVSLPREAEVILPLPRTVSLPQDFAWTESEVEKLRVLARKLNCSPEVARELLVYFLQHVRENRRGLAVAKLPEVLAPFPVKWGYKKKRNDFLKLLHDMEFIYVEVNYWAKVRAKQYGLAAAGRNLLERLDQHAPPTSNRIELGRPYATLPSSSEQLPGA